MLRDRPEFDGQVNIENRPAEQTSKVRETGTLDDNDRAGGGVELLSRLAPERAANAGQGLVHEGDLALGQCGLVLFCDDARHLADIGDDTCVNFEKRSADLRKNTNQ